MSSSNISLNDYDIAIVGGGFSGVSTAYHLAKQLKEAKQKLKLLLIEANREIGAGIAYATKNPAHILNVPAAKMSIDDQDPDSFINWIKVQGLSYKPEDYIPRMLYQQYLASVLDSNVMNDLGLQKIDIIFKNIVSVSHDTDSEFEYKITSECNTSYQARFVVIAVGNSLVNSTQHKQDSLADPWDNVAIQSALSLEHIAIIGTGLTAVDTVLALESQGYRGRYTLISRRGLLPKAHTAEHQSPVTTTTVQAALLKKSTLREHLHESRKLQQQGISWEAIIDSFRPIIHSLWANYSLKDKRRFLRHLRAPWDSIRHRIPLQSSEKVRSLINNNRLTILRGKLVSSLQSNMKTNLIVSRHSEERSLQFDLGFNCTGIWSNLRATNNPLINSLIDNKLAEYDQLNLGFKATQAGELIGRVNKVSKNLFTLGSLRRGELWESTAAREIRSQASEIAKTITQRVNA